MRSGARGSGECQYLCRAGSLGQSVTLDADQFPNGRYHASVPCKELRAHVVVSDKGYDTDALVTLMHVVDACPNAAAKQSSPKKAYERHFCQDRNLQERFFNRLKQFRRITTQFDTLATNFVSLLNLEYALFSWLNCQKNSDGENFSKMEIRC